MTARSTPEWEALLEGLAGVKLAPGVEISPPFDDNPDQSDVRLPTIHVEGVTGWSTVSVPIALRDIFAAAPEAVAEVVRLRRELETLRDDLATAHESHGWDDYESGIYRGLRMAHDHIVRILEGNDE